MNRSVEYDALNRVTNVVSRGASFEANIQLHLTPADAHLGVHRTQLERALTTAAAGRDGEVMRVFEEAGEEMHGRWVEAC